MEEEYHTFQERFECEKAQEKTNEVHDKKKGNRLDSKEEDWEKQDNVYSMTLSTFPIAMVFPSSLKVNLPR